MQWIFLILILLGSYPFIIAKDAPAFSIHFDCGLKSEFCDKSEKVIRRAAERVISEFRIRRTINIHVSMLIPCQSVNSDRPCPEANLLGSASPYFRVPVRHRDDNQIYLYPTALLKQTDIEGINEMVWPKFDILARFNALKNWYFPQDGSTINPQQRDLELTATHEFLHGLGYGDDLLMTFRPDKNASILMPYFYGKPGTNLPPNTPFNQAAFAQFMGPSIWNRFTYLSNKYLLEYFHLLQETFKKLKESNELIPFPEALGGEPGIYTTESVILGLKKDSNVLSIMETMYRDGTKPNSLEFRCNSWPPDTPYNAIQILETGLKPFNEASSGSHAAISFNKTADFLMVYSFGGTSIANLIRESNAPISGIGPNTREVLLSMGYPPANGEIKSLRDLAYIEPAALKGNLFSSSEFQSTLNPSVHWMICLILIMISQNWL